MGSNAAFNFGPGRPSKNKLVDGVAELSPADIASAQRAPQSRVQTLRDSHHRLARLLASGLKQVEVAEISGYSANRIAQLRQDPAFMELVEHYRKMVNEGFVEAADEYYRTVSANRAIAARLINDKLSDEETAAEIPIRTLLAVHSDAADRTGYPKRTLAVNVNLDFAARLEKAVKRSKEVKTIEAKAEPAEAGVPTSVERRF